MEVEERESVTSDIDAAWDDVETKTEEVEVNLDAIQDKEPSEVEAEVEVEVADEQNDDGVPVTDQPDASIADAEEAGSDTPPVGLSPAAREAWKDTPQEVRNEIAKREADYEKGIAKHRDNSARALGMDKALAPFSQYLSMSGQPPAQTVSTLLQTASMLQMGSPVQKAEQVAQLISQFGVDISALDGILANGQAPAQTQEASAIQQQIQAAIQPFQQREQQFQQQQQQAQQQQVQKINTELETFAKDPANEFYADVRMDMADIMDMGTNRGRQIGLQEAYQQACKIHPQIGKILDTRTAAAEVAKRQQAATSITGSPGGADAPVEHDDLRNTIDAIWSNAGKV